MKKLLLLLCAFLICKNAQSQATVWNTENFESETRSLNVKGSVISQNGIWIDGGSYVSTKTTEYAVEGNAAGVLTSGVPNADKPFYGSFYTKPLNLAETNLVTLDFDYFLYNKTGLEDLTGFKVEALDANGDFFPIKTIFVQDICDGTLSTGGFKCMVQDPKSFCDVWYTDRFFVTSCKADIADYKQDFWYHESILIPDAYYLENSVFRIQAFFSENPDLELYLDNLEISYTGGSQPTVNELSPLSEKTSLSKNLFNTEAFKNQTSASWGIWKDGGGDAYQSTSYARLTDAEYEALQTMLDNGTEKADIEDAYDNYVAGDSSLALRDYYDAEWLEDVDDEYSGEKSTYSSIYTENLDFTTYQELELHFSFVAINLEAEPETDITKNGRADDSADGFSLSISRDAGISFTKVRSWVVGRDFSNEVRYKDVSVVIRNSDFDYWSGPGDDFDGFTTTTVLKITSESDDDTDVIYFDDVAIYTAGDSGMDPGAQSSSPIWSQLDYSLLNSDGGLTGTYNLINGVFHPDGFTDFEVRLDLPGQFGAVEHSDCSHDNYPNIPNGITEEFDNDLGINVFSFNIDLEADTDRCKNTDCDLTFDQDIDEGETECHPYKSAGVMGGDGEVPDRQRIEFKTYSYSNEFQKAELGETHIYAWKFKLPADFAATDRFTHLHQLKSRDADKLEEGKPLITLTAGGPKTNQEEIDAGETDEPFTITSASEMRLRYSPADESQINLAIAPLEPFLGRWVQCVEKITVGEWNGDGRYELLITDALTGEEIMNFTSYTLRMYKTNASFMRAKWGIYRSLIEQEKLQDEKVKFADIMVMEVNDPNASIQDFSTWYQSLSGQVLGGSNDSAFRIEAEDYADMKGVGTKAANDEGGGFKVNKISTTDWMDYTVSIAAEGTYNINYRVATAEDDVSIQFQAQGNTLATTEIPNTGGWNNFQTVSATLNLSAGTQTIRVYSENGKWDFNWFEIIMVEIPPFSSVIQAEDYTDMSGVRTSTTTDEGGGNLVGWIDTGDWMDYQINVPATGTYTIDYRLSSIYSTGKVEFQVQGNTLATTNIPNTGDWQSFETVSITVPLSSGIQTIRLHGSVGGWDINWFEIEEAEVSTLFSHIEAEDYTNMSGIRIGTDTDEGEFVGWTHTGDWMEYQINVPNDGYYTINYRTATIHADRDIELQVDGATIATTTLPDTDGWYNFETVSTTINLAEGDQTIRLYAPTGGWNINWFEIDKTEDPQVSLLFQAEDYTDMSGIATTTTIDTGGGDIVGWTHAGDWMDYQVTIPATGTYSFDCRVASKRSTGEFQLQIDGRTYATIAIPNTGGWQAFTTVSTNIILSAGTHDVRLYVSGNSWNINWFEIKDATIAFDPDPDKIYYLKAENGMWLAGDGESDKPYTVEDPLEAASSQELRWKFVNAGNGLWYLQKATDGTKSRLTGDESANTTMQSTASNNEYTQYSIEGSNTYPGTYHLTLNGISEEQNRLFFNEDGQAHLISDSYTGSETSIEIIEAFVPEAGVAYHIQFEEGIYLASDGESNDPYGVTDINDATDPSDVEWSFVDSGDGAWHLQRAAGGTIPRLRNDGTDEPDMHGENITGDEAKISLIPNKLNPNVHHMANISELFIADDAAFGIAMFIMGVAALAPQVYWLYNEKPNEASPTFTVSVVGHPNGSGTTTSTSSFNAEQGEMYTIKSQDGLYLASDGESHLPYTVTQVPEDSTVIDLLWHITDTDDGYHHVDRAFGGSKSRLRAGDIDNPLIPFMDSLWHTDEPTIFDIEESDLFPETFNLVLPQIDDVNKLIILIPNTGGINQSRPTVATSTEARVGISPVYPAIPEIATTTEYSAATRTAIKGGNATGTSKQKKKKVTALIFIRDKSVTTHQNSIGNPSAFLSEEAIVRPGRAVTVKDLPVNDSHLAIMRRYGATIYSSSKWINAVHVTMDYLELQTMMFQQRRYFSCYRIVRPPIVGVSFGVGSAAINTINATTETQLVMLDLDLAHTDNHRGSGIRVGVVDSEFAYVNQSDAFAHLFDNNDDNGEIIGTINTPENNNNAYGIVGDFHGTQVLSVLAGKYGDVFSGSAYEAQFLLGVRNSAGSAVQNAYNLSRTIEFFDQSGVDVINMSVTTRYSTTINSRPELLLEKETVEYAVELGIVYVIAVGNDGVSTIKTPTDAVGIIAVGSVGINHQRSSFSTFGIDNYGNSRPDVCALGEGVAVVDPTSSSIRAATGTSVAAPLVAGFAAIARQYYPNYTGSQIRDMILASGHIAGAPNIEIGNGVPSFAEILGVDDNARLTSDLLEANVIDDKSVVYPNPANQTITIGEIESGETIMIYSLLGEKMLETADKEIDISFLHPGFYYALTQSNKVYKFLKQD